MKKALFYIYQVLVLLPAVVLATIIVGMLIMLVSPLLPSSQRDGYNSMMGRAWGRIIISASLLPVTVEGRERIAENQSYVFVANHLSCYDIFLIIGYLDRKIKWMLKASLLKIPFLGGACRISGFIPVDTSSPSKVYETYRSACASIGDGVSLMVFPEGSRSGDGHLGAFRRGAFMIASKLNVPVVPITLIGTYDVMPRHRDFRFICRKPLKMIIHEPVMPVDGEDNAEFFRARSREVIARQIAEEEQSQRIGGIVS